MRFSVFCASLIWGLLVSSAVHATDALDGWRIEVGQTRRLLENDLPRASAAAKRLQATLPADATPVDQARLLNLLSRIALSLAQTEQAEKYAQQAMALAKQHGDRVGQAEADLNIVMNAINQGNVDEAGASAAHALEVLEGVDRPDLLGEAMLRTSMMYRRTGRINESVTLSMQQMEIARRVNTPLVLAYAYQGLAITYDQNGLKKESREYYARELEQARAIPSTLLEADALLGMGNTPFGDSRENERLIHQAIAIYRSVGGPFYLSRGLFTLGDFLRHQQRNAEALPLFNESATIYESHANKIGLWWSLWVRSEVQQALGHLTAAQSDAERSQALAKDIGVTLYLAESAKRLSAMAAARGDYRRAYKFSTEAAEIGASASRKSASEHVAELAQRYESDSRQRQLEEINRRNQLQAVELQALEIKQRWLWTLLGAAFVMLVGTVYFLLHLRRSQRSLEALNAQVKRSQYKLQATIDAIPDPLFVLDLDGRYLEVHSLRTDLLVAPAQVLIGKTVHDMLPPDAADVCMSALVEAHEKGASTGKQFELQLPHGKFWFVLSVACKFENSRLEPRFVVISHDVTDRKRIERHLQESQFLLRQLAVRNETAREDERKHLKRELHDELGQNLLALRMGVSVIDIQFGSDNAHLREKTQRLMDMLDSTIKVVRNVVTALRPSALDLGIVAALEWLVDEYEHFGGSGLRCELHVCEAELELDDVCATAIFRIVQESLTNIVRHAHASKVDITLERSETNYLLEVRDNGQGFDPGIRKEKSFGLVSIRERALALGGEVDIDSAPGRSTSVKVHIPIHHVANKALSES